MKNTEINANSISFQYKLYIVNYLEHRCNHIALIFPNEEIQELALQVYKYVIKDYNLRTHGYKPKPVLPSVLNSNMWSMATHMKIEDGTINYKTRMDAEPLREICKAFNLEKFVSIKETKSGVYCSWKVFEEPVSLEMQIPINFKLSQDKLSKKSAASKSITKDVNINYDIKKQDNQPENEKIANMKVSELIQAKNIKFADFLAFVNNYNDGGAVDNHEKALSGENFKYLGDNT